MNNESSSFGEPLPNKSIFSDPQPLSNPGATSDIFKVRVYGKWHFLKRPKKDFVSNPIYIAAFEKEFDLGFSVDHVNIVRYYYKGIDDEGFYLITEYIDGRTLNEIFENERNIIKDKELVRKIILQILSALDYLHSHQIFHLDLKPENIIITNKGNNVKIVDLGFSIADNYDHLPGGTPKYSSPEQFNNDLQSDARSDIFAFGKLLMFLFSGNTDHKSVKKIPYKYRNVAIKCIRNDPQVRYSKISDITKRIEIYERKHKITYNTALILGISIIISLIFIMFYKKSPVNIIVRNSTQNEKISDMPVKPDRISVLIDSVFSEYKIKYPKITSENLIDATKKYNEIQSWLYNWKILRLKTMKLSERPLFETEFNRISIEKSTEIIKPLQQQTLKITYSSKPFKIKQLRENLRIKLMKIYSPLQQYNEITKENFEESTNLYKKLCSTALDTAKKMYVQIKADPDLAGKFNNLFMEEHTSITESYLYKRIQYMNITKNRPIKDSSKIPDVPISK